MLNVYVAIFKLRDCKTCNICREEREEEVTTERESEKSFKTLINSGDVTVLCSLYRHSVRF